MRVSVGAVVALGDEMLAELRPERDHDDEEPVTWIVGPASVAAIVALSRWHDEGAVVTVVEGPAGFAMHTPQLRVTVHARYAPHVSR